jgi:hypothetical protein
MMIASTLSVAAVDKEHVDLGKIEREAVHSSW